MASLFSALLPAHLKEKLGMRSKERDKVKSVRKPLATNNTTQARLSTELRSQVQSPGFTSRLSSLARNENSMERKNLSPRYSMVGNLTNVGLRNQTLPKLENRRISGGRGSPNVTVRLAPSDPFSPFKRRQSSESQSRERNVEEESKRNISSDPRSVIAVLAELSKKRKVFNDDQSETGSKRARRDSSSSIGSSLSMEMPPLFSSGVVGQTTSHLVNREADLSLGSLLSRNQSMFGHSQSHTSSGMPSSNVTLSTTSGSNSGGQAVIGQRQSLNRDMTTTAISNINNYSNITTIAGGGYRGTAVDAVKRMNNTTSGPGGESVRAEMLASLSSSRCMLQKRKRGDVSEDSDSDSSEFQLETPKPKRINNSFRFVGDSIASGSRKQSRDSSRRSSRQSSDGSPGATPIRGDRSSTPAKDGPVLVLPLPADMIRPLSKVKNDKARMVTKEDLNKERSLQKKRLDKLLKAFDDDNASDNNIVEEKKDDTSLPATSTVKTTTSTAEGSGFAFNLAKPIVGQTQNSASGFTFDLNKKDEKDGASSSEKKEDKPSDDKTKTASEESTKSKPHTVTFSVNNEGDENNKITALNASEDGKSGKSISSILKHKVDETKTGTGLSAVTSGLSTSSAPSNLPDIAQVSSPPSAVAAFTFGKTTATLAPATDDSSSEKAPPPAYSFGSTSAVKPASTTQESTLPTFSFGSSKPETAKLVAPSTTPVNPVSTQLAVSSFGLPAVKKDTETAALKPSTTGFSFGSSAATPTVNTEEKAPASFSFGASAAKPVTVAENATKTTSAAFSFGVAPNASKSATNAFQFGGSSPAAVTTTPQSTTTAPAPSFQFGASSTTTAAATKAASTATFSFGAAAAPAPAATATPSFAFGSTSAKPNDSFSFGAAAGAGNQPSTGSTPAKASMFQFGAGGASAQSNAAVTSNTVAPQVGGSAFTFGKTSGAEPAAAKPVFGFGGADIGAKKDIDNNTGGLFSFGANPSAGTAAPPAFGAAPVTTKASSAFGSSGALPTFGAASSSSTTSFGAPVPAFGNPASSTVPAASPFGTPANNSNAGGLFSFGKQEPSKPTAVAAASPFSFGGGAAQPQKQASGAFSFGGSGATQQTAVSQNTATASPFAFGGGSSSQVAAPSVSSTTVGAASGSGMFSFGGAAPSTTSAPKPNNNAAFNFGQAAPVQSPQAQSGMFQFGGAAPAQVASPFGNSVQQNAAPSPFGAPAPTFASPAVQSPPGGMFSIGAGGNQNRASQQPRKYAQARRTRK